MAEINSQFSNVNNTAWLTSCYSIEAAYIHLPDGSTLAGVTAFCLAVISWGLCPQRTESLPS